MEGETKETISICEECYTHIYNKSSWYKLANKMSYKHYNSADVRQDIDEYSIYQSV